MRREILDVAWNETLGQYTDSMGIGVPTMRQLWECAKEKNMIIQVFDADCKFPRFIITAKAVKKFNRNGMVTKILQLGGIK